MTPLTDWLQYEGGESLFIGIAVKAFVLSALALMATAILRRASAATRHLVWLGALVAMLLLPIFTIVVPGFNVSWMPDWTASPFDATPDEAPGATGGLGGSPSTIIQESLAAQGYNPTHEDVPVMNSARSERGMRNTAMILGGLWMGGFFCALVPVLVGISGLRILRGESDEVTDPATLELIEEARSYHGIGRNILLRRTRSATVPLTWGTHNPVLLLPEAFFAWTRERQRIVILHELAHIKRLDWLTQFVAQFACAVYWFNPLVWLAVRDMRIQRELASDDLVLRAGSRPADYANELLAIAVGFGERQWLGRSAGIPMARPSTLDGRLISILDRQKNRSGVGWIETLTVAACFVAVAIPLAALQSAQSSPATSTAAPPGRSEIGLPITDRQKAGVDAGQVARMGAKLDRQAVVLLEAALAKDAEDLETRIQLIGYYNAQRHGALEARSTHAKHVLWLIEHQPEHPLISTPYCRIDTIHRPTDYSRGKQLLLSHLQSRPNDLNLLANAANYFTLQDKNLGIDLLNRGSVLEPGNPYWHERLGHQYKLMRTAALSQVQQDEYARKSFESFERAYETASELTKSRLLAYVAQSALAAGELEKAGQYARLALRQGDDFGDHHFAGHTILGQIALTKDDVASAKDHLLQSAQVDGSPVLDSFGPNMSLAKELIERGETESVLAFFESCGRFWKSDNVDKWAAQVREGRMPDFGANLNY